MPRIALIPPAQAGPELRAAYRCVSESLGARGAGRVAPQVMQCLSQRPELMRACAEGYRFVGWGGRLPRALRELVAIVVSRENECFY